MAQGGSSKDRRKQKRIATRMPEVIPHPKGIKTEVADLPPVHTDRDDYTFSDKLAVALACLAGIMAIILFLAEKAPLTVVSLLLLMVALAIYPIMHFVRRQGWRIAAFVCFLIGTLLFGWRVWPTAKPTKETTRDSTNERAIGPNTPAGAQETKINSSDSGVKERRDDTLHKVLPPK